MVLINKVFSSFAQVQIEYALFVIELKGSSCLYLTLPNALLCVALSLLRGVGGHWGFRVGILLAAPDLGVRLASCVGSGRCLVAHCVLGYNNGMIVRLLLLVDLVVVSTEDSNALAWLGCGGGCLSDIGGGGVATLLVSHLEAALLSVGGGAVVERVGGRMLNG